MTVGELLERMPAREFAEWQAFYREDPFGEFRADLRHGRIASAIVNMMQLLRLGKVPSEATVNDFLLRPHRTKQGRVEMKALLAGFATAAGRSKREKPPAAAPAPQNATQGNSGPAKGPPKGRPGPMTRGADLE